MLSNDRNIYQAAREVARYTQESAAELLGISVESLSAYENDRRPPPERVVIAMVEVYSDQLLAYLHMRQCMELADRVLPDIHISSLPVAVLRLQKELNDILGYRERLIEITCDGVIDSRERPEFDQILIELDQVWQAILGLKYAKE